MEMRLFNDEYPLESISPIALAFYARSEGWAKSGSYGLYSDIYSGEGKPEILLPRTSVIDDYSIAVSDLISVFTRTLDRDERAVYRDLTLADRDVIRVRLPDSDPNSLQFESTHILMNSTRGMLIAAARSLNDNQSTYPPQLTREVTNYLQRLHFGHTERGSFSLILISPAVPPQLETLQEEIPEFWNDAPIERRVARRLSASLSVMRSATEETVSGVQGAFSRATDSGVSANLCEAVADLVEEVAQFDVSFNWAITRPIDATRGPMAFSAGDIPILREASRNFRAQSPEPGRRFYGFIYRLTRLEEGTSGIVSLSTSENGRERSVTAGLNPRDYEKAIEAHRLKAMVSLEGDLEHSGNRLNLNDARLVDIVYAPELTGMENYTGSEV